MKIGKVLKKFSAGKMFVGALLVAGIVAFANTGVANAAPSYFDVAKPSSPSQCNGSTPTYSWEWRWEKNTKGPWWTWFFFGHWVKVQHNEPNWKKLGFSSKDQCVRYTTTQAPQTRADCRNGNWYTLGFNSRGQCVAYARMNGGGYGG